MSIRIYCEQYGYYWKFTPKEYRAFAKHVSKFPKDGWDLSDWGKELSGKPKGVYKDRDSRYAYSGDPDVILFHVVDWYIGDITASLDDLKRKGV